MANAQVINATGFNVTASSTAWVDVASLGSGTLTSGKTYLILAICTGTIASSANELRLRLVHGAGATVFTDASNAEEIASGSTRPFCGFMVMYTAGASDSITLQVSSAATQTATAEFAEIIAINLDDIGTLNTDYFWNEVTTDLALTTAYQDCASVTFTPNGTDKYLYLAQVAWKPGSATAQTDHHLTVDGTEVVYNSEEGEDTTNEVRNRIIVWAETPTNASHTVKVQAKGETAAGTTLSSRVFVLNLGKFAQAAINSAAGPTSLVEAAGWINLATTSVTPTATGNFVIIGSSELSWNAAPTAAPVIRLQHDNSGSLASHPAYGDNAPGADTWDGTDHRVATLFDLQSLTSGASRTINLDGEMANTGTNDPNANNRVLVAFSVALAASGTQFTISPSGAATSAGALVRKPGKALSGSATSSGALGRQTDKALSGSASSAGGLVKRWSRTLTGVAASAGSLLSSRLMVRAFSGTITSTGALVRRTSKVLAGAAGSTGALIRRTSKVLAGAAGSAGALVRQTRKGMAGGAASAGALINSRVLLRSFSGTIASVGAFQKQARSTFSGTVASGGTVVRQTRKALAGAVTSSGTVASIRTILRSFSGTVTSAGGLIRQTRRSASGTIASAGGLVRRTAKSFAGVIASSATLTAIRPGQNFTKSFAGTITSSGSLVRSTARSVSGVIASSGSLVRRTSRLMVGVASSAGGLVKQTGFTRSGSIDASGSLTRMLARAFDGVVDAVGGLTRQVAKAFAGSIGAVGDAVVIAPGTFILHVAGSITSSGSLVASKLRQVLLAAARGMSTSGRDRGSTGGRSSGSSGPR